MSARAPALYGAFLLAWALKFTVDSFGGVLVSGALSTALLLFIVLTATGMGRIALRSFGVRDLSESEKTLIGATLGVGALSQGVMVLGLLGGLKVWAVVLLLGGFWVIGATEMRDVIGSAAGNLKLLADRPLAAGAVAAALGTLLWFAWMPPHQYDALVYHLPLAEAYAREGRIVSVEHLLYSHFPQNGEMLYTLGLLLGSDSLAQMFTWLGTFLSAWWVFEMGKREMPATAALGACLLLTTHTAVMLLTPTAYVECLVMLWVTAAILSFLQWQERSRPGESPRGWLALSAVFSGLGVGTKYYAGIAPALLIAVLAGRWALSRLSRGEERLDSGRQLKDLAIFALVSGLAASPWLIRNAVVVGNPVFPFLYRLLPPRGVGWTAPSAQRYFEILVEYGLHQGNLIADLLAFPFRVASGSLRFGGGADVLGDLGWGLSVAVAPAALWAAWRNRYLRWAAAYCAAHWAIWYCTGVVLRFLVVLVPLWSMLCAHGLLRLWERAGGLGRALLAAATALMLASNLWLFLYVHTVTESLSYLTGDRTRGEYLNRLDYYPCARFIRESLPEDAKILVVGEQRGYYIGRRQVTTTVLAPNGFVREANEAEDARDLARRLREDRGITHLLFVPREAKRLEPYGIFHFTAEGGERWAALVNERSAPVFDSPGRCWVRRIEP